MKGNKRALGYMHSQETRALMSSSKLGVKHSEEHVEKSAEGRTKFSVIVDDISYLNASRAAAALGLSRDGVLKRCESKKFPNYTKERKKVNT